MGPMHDTTDCRSVRSRRTDPAFRPVVARKLGNLARRGNSLPFSSESVIFSLAEIDFEINVGTEVDPDSTWRTFKLLATRLKKSGNRLPKIAPYELTTARHSVVLMAQIPNELLVIYVMGSRLRKGTVTDGMKLSDAEVTPVTPSYA